MGSRRGYFVNPANFSGFPNAASVEVTVEVPRAFLTELHAAATEAHDWLEKACAPTIGEEFLDGGRGWVRADKIRQRLRSILGEMPDSEGTHG